MHNSCVVLISLLTQVFTFNLDVVGPIYKQGKVGTHFGYSVAQHLQGNNAKLLIGAPLDESGQMGTNRSGAMYVCPFNSHSTDSSKTSELWCSKPLVEYQPSETSPDPRKTPINVLDSERMPNDKDFELLGASISSGGKSDSSVVVCAPLSRYTKGNTDKSPRAITGECYVLNNTLQRPLDALVGPNYGDIRSCLPLNTDNINNFYGHCMQGISSTLNQELGVLSIGGIGALTHRGGIYASNMIKGDVGFESTVQRSTMRVGNYRDTENTVEKRASKHGYLGMSVGVGTFGFEYETRDKTAWDSGGAVTIVSGATRSPWGKRPADSPTSAPYATAEGRVYFVQYSQNKSLFFDYLPFRGYNLQGEKFGSHFGYSVVATDIDNDGSDDLVVGAPYHFQTVPEDKNAFSGGAIFVYFSKGYEPSTGFVDDNVGELFKQKIKILGDFQSRFGYSMTAIGDIDQDSYNDFAVGAPGYDEGQGAVYIFLGSAYEDFDVKPAQLIKSSELPTRLNSFGFSLSGGSDLDANLYPDLLVGAALSDTAILFRSRPIIKMRAEIVDSKKIIRGEKIQCRDDSWADTCFEVRTNLSILDDGLNGRKAAKASLQLLQTSRLKCKLSVLVHKESNKPRAQFGRSGDHVVEWDCGREIRTLQQEETKVHILYLTKSVADWLRPLLFEFEVYVDEKPKPVVEKQPLPDLVPIVDSREASKKFELQFDKKCGDDEVCKTDLAMQCHLAGHSTLIDDIWHLDLGKYSGISANDIKINISYKVENNGERAYQSQIFIYFDQGQLEIPALDHVGTSVINLEAPEEEGLAMVKTGNPMEENANVLFTLSYDFVEGQTDGGGKPLIFKAVINSTSEELNPDDNECILKIKIIKKAEIEMQGISKPDLLYYGGKVVGASAMKFEEDIGPMTETNYIIQNHGPWSVSNLTILVDFPYEIMRPRSNGKVVGRGRYALYPLELPVIEAITQKKDALDYKNTRCKIIGERERDVINYFDFLIDPLLEYKFDDGFKRAKRAIKAADSKDLLKNGEVSKDEEVFMIPFAPLRRIQPKEEVNRDGDKETVVTISCEGYEKTAICMRVMCNLPYLPSNGVATVKIRSRLWNSTFVRDYPDVTFVRLVSNATVLIPQDQGVQDEVFNNYANASTIAYPDLPKIQRDQTIPIWIIILAVVIGLFLLFLIIVVCWKCGFFKRNRKGRDQPNLYRAELHQTEDWRD